MRLSAWVVLFALVLMSGWQSAAAATKPWVMLTNCQYLAHADGDGDSFRVRAGTNELLVRKGLARLKGVRPNLPTGQKAAAHLATLDAIEAEAKRQKVGLWSGSKQEKKETTPP